MKRRAAAGAAAAPGGWRGGRAAAGGAAGGALLVVTAAGGGVAAGSLVASAKVKLKADGSLVGVNFTRASTRSGSGALVFGIAASIVLLMRPGFSGIVTPVSLSFASRSVIVAEKPAGFSGFE